MCNLMFDYAFERRLIYYNPARAFKVTHLIREIDEEKKVKQVFLLKILRRCGNMLMLLHIQIWCL